MDDIQALMILIDTGKDAEGHRVHVNGVMAGEVLEQHYKELGRLVYLQESDRQ